jgi:hypothetical protein
LPCGLGWAIAVMYNSFGSRVTHEPARVWLVKNRVKLLAQLVTHFQRSESSRVTNESSRASYRVTSFLSSPRRTSPTSNAPSMEAHAHVSCNRHAGRYVQATAPPLAPLPRLLDCGTSTATRGNPVYDPVVPARRDGQCGQKWAGSDGGGRRAGAAVTSSAKLTSHPGAVREPSLTA